MARATLRHPTARAGDLRRAAEAWLSTPGPDASDELAELALKPARGDLEGRTAVGEVLWKEGGLAAAARIAAEVLRRGAPRFGQLEKAARIWAAARGDACGPEIRTALEESGADRGDALFVPAQLLRAVAGFGFEEETARLARGVLTEHRWGAPWVAEVLATWLSVAGVTVAEEIMEETDRGRKLFHSDRATVALAMLEAGAHDHAAELADLALRTPNATLYSYSSAVTVLLKAEGTDAARRLPEIWRGTPGLGLDGDWLTGVLQALVAYEQGDVDQVPRVLAREQTALPSATGDEVSAALRTLVRLEGKEAGPFLVEVAKAPGRVTWTHVREIARELAALRETAHAHDLWRWLLALPHPLQALELGLLMDLQAAEASEAAAGWIRELIVDPETYAPRRLQLRQLLAWLEAAAPEPGPVPGVAADRETGAATEAAAAATGTGTGTAMGTATGTGTVAETSAGAIHTEP